MVEFGVVQDRYVGDIGDFGKYALLKALVGDELRLGVNWYLNAVEEANTDGRFTDYRRMRQCDPALFDTLQDLVCRGKRSVAEVERAGVLPGGTVFYSAPLSAHGWSDRTARRISWNARALDVLAGADLVFMDPDNGLTRRPAGELGAAAAKYVTPGDVGPFLRNGKSLIIYHHQTRQKGGLAVTIPERFALLRSLGCQTPWAFVFRRISVRVYFIVPSQAHVDTLARRSSIFLDTLWVHDGHFQLELPSG